MVDPANGAGDPGLDHVLWRTTTLCNNGSCVEVAFVDDSGVAIRDSKNRQGPILQFASAEWEAFVGGVHRGEFDLPG
jgi:hypothetical protein